MGRARGYEVIEYKKIIMSEICRSDEMAALLGHGGDPHPEESMPFECVFPYEHIPDVVTETDRYVCFDVEGAMDRRNDVFKGLTVRFYIMCHEEAIRYDDGGRKYLWYDRAACGLETIFCERNVLGIGNSEYSSNRPYIPQQKFRGRVLSFTTRDFTDGLKYGR